MTVCGAAETGVLLATVYLGQDAQVARPRWYGLACVARAV